MWQAVGSSTWGAVATVSRSPRLHNDRDGTRDEREIRFPAGTTRQGLPARTSFASRFAALRLTAPERGALGISALRALPCSLGLS